MLRLRFAPKFKKMYGLKLEHPQAQPNCTCSYGHNDIKKRSVFSLCRYAYVTMFLLSLCYAVQIGDINVDINFYLTFA